MEYGCLYCRTGYERNVVNYLLDRNIKAISPIKIRYHRRDGKKELERETLFPGYVFFAIDDVASFNDISRDFRKVSDDDPQLQEDRILRILRSHSDVIRILYDGDYCWSLEGDDKEFVEKLFAVNGEIGISKACYVGNKICIREGFLKEYEGSITAVNRRARMARIMVTIKEREFYLWLGFEEITDTLECDTLSPMEEENAGIQPAL